MRQILSTFAVLLMILTVGCSTVEPQAQPQQQTQPNAQSSNETTGGPSPGQMAPDFTLKTINGEQVRLSDLRGKKVFLNFWASWCDPCKNEMPALQALSRQYENQIAIYGVNMLSDDNIDSVQRFMLENSLTFPSLLDEKGDVMKAYRIVGLPVSITIDEQGRILDRHIGELNSADMQSLFTRLLASKPQGQATP